MKAAFLATVSALPLVLGACSGLSGVGASTSFSCDAARGVQCQSLEVVDNAYRSGTLNQLKNGGATGSVSDVPVAPVHKVATDGAASSTPAAKAGAQSAAVVDYIYPTDSRTPYSGMPIRTPEKVIRVLVFAYRDAEDDLHDNAYFYTTVSGGTWRIDASRFNPKATFRQVYPLQADAPTNGGAAAAPASQQLNPLAAKPAGAGGSSDPSTPAAFPVDLPKVTVN
ncbi:type IV conjugative transfer system lipoprotein TraV [Burkholderia cepacia]|uniref:type IV conjugative transfer system lipoprotein TraV n=1 Tax=Burkholderia cepacia TaxID=292 RepID=UPI002AB63FF8|nr:type IV conjugative transfer system lipoprotein TraV [Burkholderia cepacia]